MKRSLSIENIREDCGSWLTELPCQLLEEIFLNLSIKECFGICRTCKHFNEVITSQFFNVRFYREKLSAWDVCRYKIPNESWSCFNCRTLAAYKSMEERVNKVTEDIEKAERDMDDESKKNLVAFTYSKRGLLYLTNLRDFTQAMRDFEKASQLYSGNSVMPSALNNLGVAYLYLGNLHSKLVTILSLSLSLILSLSLSFSLSLLLFSLLLFSLLFFSLRSSLLKQRKS